MNKGKKVPSVKMTLRKGQLQHDEGLLFQFVLHELLSSAQVIKKTLNEQFSVLVFQRLVGDLGQFHTPYLLSHRHSGSLLKLYHYLLQLSIHFPKRNSVEDVDFKVVLQTAEKAISSAIDCQRFFKKDDTLFFLCFKQLHSQLKKLMRLIPKRIALYPQNENVLYFLLRRRVDFENVFHPKMINKMFYELFRGGVKEAGDWMLEQYKQRKFFHLLPLIQKQVDAF